MKDNHRKQRGTRLTTIIKDNQQADIVIHISKTLVILITQEYSEINQSEY